MSMTLCSFDPREKQCESGTSPIDVGNVNSDSKSEKSRTLLLDIGTNQDLERGKTNSADMYGQGIGLDISYFIQSDYVTRSPHHNPQLGNLRLEIVRQIVTEKILRYSFFIRCHWSVERSQR